MVCHARGINMWVCWACFVLVLVAGACSYKTTSFNNNYKIKNGKYNVLASIRIESLSIELQVPPNSSDPEAAKISEHRGQQADDSSLATPLTGSGNGAVSHPHKAEHRLQEELGIKEPKDQVAEKESNGIGNKAEDEGKPSPPKAANRLQEGSGVKDAENENNVIENKAEDEGQFSTYTKLYHHYLKRHKPWLLLPNNRMCLKERCNVDSDCCRKYNICDKSAGVCIDCWKGYPCRSGADCCERFPRCIFDEYLKDQTVGYCDNDL